MHRKIHNILTAVVWVAKSKGRQQKPTAPTAARLIGCGGHAAAACCVLGLHFPSNFAIPYGATSDDDTVKRVVIDAEKRQKRFSRPRSGAVLPAFAIAVSDARYSSSSIAVLRLTRTCDTRTSCTGMIHIFHVGMISVMGTGISDAGSDPPWYDPPWYQYFKSPYWKSERIVHRAKVCKVTEQPID